MGQNNIYELNLLQFCLFIVFELICVRSFTANSFIALLLGRSSVLVATLCLQAQSTIDGHPSICSRKVTWAISKVCQTLGSLFGQELISLHLCCKKSSDQDTFFKKYFYSQLEFHSTTTTLIQVWFR